MGRNRKLSAKAELIACARMHLEMERSLGIQALDIQPGKRAAKKKAASRPATEGQVVATSKVAALATVEKELAACGQCSLVKQRKRIVFGVGSPDADLMFIGEAPGADEDEQGIPFVGRAGQLLTKIIESIGLSRADVYIANICKCRPPENRQPTPEEAALCFPYLRKQIAIIKPKIIVCLGNVPTKMFLQTELGITKLRGKFAEWNGIIVMPTFHPSYLLRNPPAKREVWEDMQAIWKKMKELGLKVGELAKPVK